MFGLIGHLTSLEQAHKASERLGYLDLHGQDLDFWCSAPPQIIDEFTVKSLTGETITGKYVESCFLPEMLTQRRIKAAMRKVLNAMAHAQKANIDITALGGFSSIVFENFNLYNNPQVRNVALDFRRFTTGNTHTAYIISRQVELAVQQLGMSLSQATIAVCGATGDIGSAVCRWLNEKTPLQDLLLVARNQERLNALQLELGRGKIVLMEEALSQADIVVWVASLPKGVEIDAETLKKPSLVIDGGYPKNFDTRVKDQEVFVLKGGIVEHSFDIEWNIMEAIEMEIPSRQLFACFAESMLLEFEKWYTNFSWGRNQITVAKMEQIGAVSQKHGFKPLLLNEAVTAHHK